MFFIVNHQDGFSTKKGNRLVQPLLHDRRDSAYSGQIDFEYRSFAQLAVDFHLAFMLLYDPMNDRQSQPGATAQALGTEIGFENALDVGRLDSATAVFEANANVGPGRQVRKMNPVGR